MEIGRIPSPAFVHPETVEVSDKAAHLIQNVLHVINLYFETGQPERAKAAALDLSRRIAVIPDARCIPQESDAGGAADTSGIQTPERPRESHPPR